MSLRRRIKTFASLSRLEKVLFAACLVMTILFRLSLYVLSYQRLLTWQGKVGTDSASHADLSSLRFRTSLHRALSLCSRYIPFLASCYALSLAGKYILRKKGLPSTLYIGFRKTAEGGYEGHAWLRSYDTWITGGGKRHLYIVHSQYT